MNKEAKRSILLIRNRKDEFLGLGFVLASTKEGTYILTASHVIKYPEKENVQGNQKLKIEGNEEVEVLCEGDSCLNDIAVLFIKKLIHYPSLQLYPDKKLLLNGTKYTLLGYSFKEDRSNAYTQTEVRGKIEEQVTLSSNNREVFVYEVETRFMNEIDRGYSGTAVFLDDTNIVIGILSSKREDSQLAYVIPIQHLKEVWNSKENWNDVSKWREMPSEWFLSDNLGDVIKEKFISNYSPSSRGINFSIVFSLIGILFFLIYDKLD